MDIGKAVKTQRMLKNLSIRDLASITGLSPGAISKIENGKTIPNVVTMKNIATAMGVSVSYFFMDDEDELIQVVKRDKRETIIRNNENSGEVFEQILTKGKDLSMQPTVITFTPSSSSGASIAHKGEEFIYILFGKVRCVLEGMGEYELDEGDSIYYPSSILHRWENKSDNQEAKIIVVASPSKS